MWGAVELRPNLITRAARASSLRTAALDHESRNDAVEDHVVVKPDLREAQEILHVAGRDFGQKREPNWAFGRVELHGVIVFCEVDLFLGFLDLGFDVGGQGTHSLVNNPVARIALGLSCQRSTGSPLAGYGAAAAAGPCFSPPWSALFVLL